MKGVKTTVAALAFVSASSFAATKLSQIDINNYQPIGSVSVVQPGVPDLNHTALSNAADQKCKKMGVTQCYYSVTNISGNDADHKIVNANLYTVK